MVLFMLFICLTVGFQVDKGYDKEYHSEQQQHYKGKYGRFFEAGDRMVQPEGISEDCIDQYQY